MRRVSHLTQQQARTFLRWVGDAAGNRLREFTRRIVVLLSRIPYVAGTVLPPSS